MGCDMADMDNEQETETVTELSEHILPFGRRVRLQNVDFHNGLNMLRMIWREGRRLTIIDIDPESATRLGEEMAKWGREKAPKTDD